MRDDLEAVRIETVAVNMLRDGDVAARVQRRQQIEPLKHEADLVAAQLGALRVVHGNEIVAVHQHVPARGLRQSSHHIEQRGLAAARGAHHGHEFARQHFEVDAAQRRNLHLSRAVHLPQIFGNDDRLHS